MSFQIAQVNMGRLAAPLDSEQLAAFVEALDPVNASADAAPGFVWRLQTGSGNATEVTGFQFDAVDGAEVILNMSVWTGIEPLAAWVFGDLHREILRRRREFFQRMTAATLALWWVPAGHLPSVAEAEERLLLLRRVGPSPDGVHVPPRVRAAGRARVGAARTRRVRRRLDVPGLSGGRHRASGTAPMSTQARSKRSRFMTLSHAATKSRTNASFAVVAGVDLGQAPQLRVRAEDEVGGRRRPRRRAGGPVAALVDALLSTPRPTTPCPCRAG